MRLHFNDSQSLIQNLALSIQKDPASMEHWRCLHLCIHPDLKETHQSHYLDLLKEHYKDLDCEVICCADGDILIISREPDIYALYELAEDIAAKLSTDRFKLNVTYYELFYDWRAIRSMLLEKAGNAPLPATTSLPEQIVHTSEEFFREVSSLREVFSVAKTAKDEQGLPLQVMLVEDDPVTRRMVATLLKDKYALITAKDALEAVANYLMHAPDIVFLDINLPDVSGFHVLHQIIACDPDAYVVMFSGHNYLDNITAALGNGASGFVAKPFRGDKLTHYIEDCAMQQRRLG